MGRAVDRPDVVETEEASLKHIVARRVFPIDPPGEVEQQLLEDLGQEGEVVRAVDLEDAKRSPGVHRRVHVAERPFVRRQLAVGMHVPLTAKQQQLVLCEPGVNVGKRHAVERQIPGCVPGVLPLVGHRYHIGVVEMTPFAVAAVTSIFGWLRPARVTVEPASHVIMEELLRPQHPGKSLTHDISFIRRGIDRGQRGVELICLPLAVGQHCCGARRAGSAIGTEAQLHSRLGASAHVQPVAQRRFGADSVGVHRVGAVNHMVSDTVLRVARTFPSPQATGVRFVVTHQRLVRAGAGQGHATEFVVLSDDGAVFGHQLRTPIIQPPRPSVAEPQRGQHIEGRVPIGSITNSCMYNHVVWTGFGVVDHDVPVATVEHAGVIQLILGVESATTSVLGDEVGIGKLVRRIQIAPPHPRMGGRGVEVPPVLFGILAMVAFISGQTKDAFLEDGVMAVPKRERKAHPLLVVADAGKTVFVPPISPRAGLVMREGVPRFTVLAVVLAYCPPGPFGQIGPPTEPGGTVTLQSLAFDISHDRIVRHGADSLHVSRNKSLPHCPLVSRRVVEARGPLLTAKSWPNLSRR